MSVCRMLQDAVTLYLRSGADADGKTVFRRRVLKNCRCTLNRESDSFGDPVRLTAVLYVFPGALPDGEEILSVSPGDLLCPGTESGDQPPEGALRVCSVKVFACGREKTRYLKIVGKGGGGI